MSKERTIDPKMFRAVQKFLRNRETELRTALSLLSPGCGVPESGMGTVPPAEWVLERPSGGTTSQVFFARRREAPQESAPLCCVRAFRRRSSWLHYRESLRRLEDHAICAPRLLGASRDRFGWLPGPWLLAESFVDGPLLRDVPLVTEVARQVGESLALLHTPTAPWFEAMGHRYPPKDYAPRLLKKARRRIGRLLQAPRPRLPGDAEVSEELDSFERWLEKRFARWTPPDRFPLTHSALDDDDMIWLSKRSEVAWLDLGRMGHDHRGFDLVMIRRRLELRGGAAAAGLLSAFDQGYWSLAGEAEQTRWSREEPLFDALRALAHWTSVLKSTRYSGPEEKQHEILQAREIIRRCVEN